MSQTSDLTENILVKNVLIENISYARSAFGVTAAGEQVFISNRIVDRLGLETDMVVSMELLPNYPDKREQIPWRAVRVNMEKGPEPTPATPIDKGKLIVDLIEDYGPLRTATIARHLNLTVDEVSTLLTGLFSEKRIAMAEVYSDPVQKRASIRVWGIDINDFDLSIGDTD